MSAYLRTLIERELGQTAALEPRARLRFESSWPGASTGRAIWDGEPSARTQDPALANSDASRDRAGSPAMDDSVTSRVHTSVLRNGMERGAHRAPTSIDGRHRVHADDGSTAPGETSDSRRMGAFNNAPTETSTESGAETQSGLAGTSLRQVNRAPSLAVEDSTTSAGAMKGGREPHQAQGTARDTRLTADRMVSPEGGVLRSSPSRDHARAPESQKDRQEARREGLVVPAVSVADSGKARRDRLKGEPILRPRERAGALPRRPVVQIQIGRIEIRAVHPAPSNPSPSVAGRGTAEPQRSTMTLAQYLQRRSRDW